MEISSFRHPISYTGEDKYEMLELNRRLESYLNHVKVLEEENQLLWREIQAMRMKQDTGGQRKAREEELCLARKELQNAWREKDHVELEVINLLEEIEKLNMLRQKENSAQFEAKRKLEESRKGLEDERRMQIWLKEQAAHLEKEVSLEVKVHQEDLAAVKSSFAFSKKPVLMAPQHNQTLNLQGLGEEYSQRAAQAWREAAAVYQTQMKKVEESLDHTRAHMTLIKQEKKESQLQVQNLAKELESAKAKRELIEKTMAQQRQKQNQDLQHFQAHLEALEAEKLDLSEQVGELMVESRNLLQMKMSLSLEVATYRALLDGESVRVNQSGSKKNSTISLLEGITKSPRIPPGTQAISSCLFSSPLNTSSRSITHKANLMTPTWNLTLRTPQETPKRPQTYREEEAIVRVENQKLETSTTISEMHLTGAGSHDDYRAEEEESFTASVSATESSKSEIEPESVLNRNIKEDVETEHKAELGLVLFSTNETAMITSPARHLQTPESVSSSQHIEEAKSSDGGDEEETEVSTEMAQISHAPLSAWEENETVIRGERDVVSELELESGDIAENSTQEFRIDAAELQLLGENTHKPASPLLQDIPHLSEDTFSPVEDDSEILTWADVNEDVIHFVEEESLKSAPEVERKSVKGNEDVEEKMEIEPEEWPGTEMVESHQLDISEVDEENETEQEKKVEQSKEELTNGEEEKMIEEKIGENFGEPKAEVMPYEKDNLVGEKAEAVMDTVDKDQLVEHNAENEQEQSDDESLNITASWRTDPGEADSYAQENTLADTRPLIHYKSDEETDANIPVSHLGVNEPTNSEEEREQHVEDSNWSQIISKRFDTMEDLSEEPEIGSMDDIVPDGSVQTVLKQNMDEEKSDQTESGDMDSHVQVDQSESDLRNNSNENNQGEEETQIENYHLSTSVVETQEVSSQLHDWSASLHYETRDMNEQQTLLTREANIFEDIEYIDNTEDSYLESREVNPKCESEDKKYFDNPLPEPSQEQELAEEPCEETSTEITHSDVLLLDTAITVEQACPKEEYVQSNLSMFTHAVFPDEFSLHSYPESQTNTEDSDLEEPNSSEDESPNASQCSQLLCQSEMQVQQLDPDSATIDVVSKADPGLLSGVLKEESPEDYNAPQAEELENKEEQQYVVDSSSGGMGLPQEWENLGHTVASASHSTAEESGDVEMENTKDMDAFQGDALKEECQTNEKENDQSIYSSSIQEGISSVPKFEMAATYDPSTQEFRIDADGAELQLLGENTHKPASPLLQEIPHLSADTFSPVEDDSEILTWADVKDDVIHFVDEEPLKSAPEVERKSVKGNEDVEEKMEIESAEWPSTEVLKGHQLDIKVQEKENGTEQEEKLDQSKEEELSHGKEEKTIEEKIGENFGELKAEFLINTYEKGNLVGEKVMEAVMDTVDKDQLVEHNAEEEQGQSEDESLNITASWRTDPGEADSYAQENTLADTRPLIHYKSDEETDANIPISYLGVNEPTNSEEEREQHVGDSHWSQIIAKRFDTMEDLSEEPEMGSMDDIVPDGLVQTVLKQNMDEEKSDQTESDDMDSHVQVDQSESDLRNNSNENNQGEEETQIENYHLSSSVVETQEVSSQLHDWSASLHYETRDMNEQQTLKSDEETDANIPISHLGVNEPTNSEEEREQHVEDSNWSHIISKRFDTMEDLSEEPEIGSMDDIVSDGSVQTVLKQNMDEEKSDQNESGDMDSHVQVDQSESDLRNNSNENNQGEEETQIENYHLSTSVVEKQEVSSQLHNWSASLHYETRDMNKQQTLLTREANIFEDIEYIDNTEDSYLESREVNPEGESEDKKYFDNPLPEPSQEQELAEEPCEETSTEITHSDVLLLDTAITVEQACPKEEYVQSNLSMFTHAVFPDEFSLHSYPESQTNTEDSDLEEPNSSEDESPNASQCSQLLCQSEMQVQQLDPDSATIDVVSKADPGLLSCVLKEESPEDYIHTEKKEEQQYVLDGSSSGGMGLPQEWENLGHTVTSASHNILSTTEESGDVEMEKKDMDAFQGDVLKEECQTNEKENAHHKFFSSSTKEGTGEFETAATYDPDDQTETERYTFDSINPNQSMYFGEDWRNPQTLPSTNSKPEKDLGIPIAQSTEEEWEEQKMAQVQCRDVKDGDEQTVHVEDSTDEGDSWSSGEE